jgi:hypothetical protein
MDDRGSIAVRGSDGIFFSSPPRPDRFWGPPSLLSSGYLGAFTAGVKRPGRKPDYSPPSGVEVKNEWRYAAAPPIRLQWRGA